MRRAVVLALSVWAVLGSTALLAWARDLSARDAEFAINRRADRDPWQATNRSQSFRAYFDGHGVRVVPGDDARVR